MKIDTEKLAKLIEESITSIAVDGWVSEKTVIGLKNGIIQVQLVVTADEDDRADYLPGLACIDFD